MKLESRRSFYIMLVLLTACVSALYDYSTHGEDWPSLFPSCNKAEMGPRNISSQSLSKHSYFFPNYKDSPATLQAREWTLVLTGDFGQSFTMNEKGLRIGYKAVQIRLRSRSQHSIDGAYFPLQMQVYHKQLQEQFNQKLVLSILFDGSKDVADPLLQAIRLNQTVSVDLNRYADKESARIQFNHYFGTVSYPPCQKANWIILRQVFTMSKKQQSFFVSLFNNDTLKGNYRQPQKGQTYLN